MVTVSEKEYVFVLESADAEVSGVELPLDSAESESTARKCISRRLGTKVLRTSWAAATFLSRRRFRCENKDSNWKVGSRLSSIDRAEISASSKTFPFESTGSEGGLASGLISPSPSSPSSRITR